ncbi:MAG: alpha-hydroxy-acid oxidizing protein [Rhizobiales bacterium]|nr:alpha-hydroxy-acid oxidizing protein [Hyphomicrobiales bacterium]
MAAPLNFDQARERARRWLPRLVFEYIDRGTEDEISLVDTAASWDDVALRPSVLVDVSKRSAAAEILGCRVSFPLVIAPTALAGLVWYDGEVALARAAHAAGVPFCVATQSVTSIEEIADSKARLWLQLYVWRERSRTFAFLERAAAAGAEVLVLTVDTPISPKREYNIRNGFNVPYAPTARSIADALMHPRWLVSVLLRHILAKGFPTYGHYPSEFRSKAGRERLGTEMALDDRVNWSDVAELRRRWQGPLVLKGILSLEDARLAVRAGCDGIVVSNHGARNLDAAPTPVEVLPEIADAVGDQLTVLADSGIRRGSHIARALALGAKGVLAGRAPLYGLACGGEAGARNILAVLRDELERTMAGVGVTDVAGLAGRAMRSRQSRSPLEK